MEIERLVYMANQIANYFKAYPDEEAIAGVEEHLRQFWEPRMRAQLIKHLDTGGTGLAPIALAATKRLQKKAPASN